LIPKPDWTNFHCPGTSLATWTRAYEAELIWSHHDNVFGRWINFDHLIKNLAKVIAMDANTGFCVYDLLASSCKHVD